MRSVLKNLKSDLFKIIDRVSIAGENNIKSELEKRKIKASVKTIRKGNRVSYEVTPETNQIESSDNTLIALKSLGVNVPVELLNQEMQNVEIPSAAIDAAMKRTDRRLKKEMDKKIKELL